MEIDTNGVQLGDKVQDSITGLVGKVTAVHKYVTGCARASIQPPVGPDGKVPDTYGCDVTTLTVLEPANTTPAMEATRRSGGPHADPHSRV